LEWKDQSREIKTLINASVERVERGTTLEDEAGETMTEVITAIGRSTDTMAKISAASNALALKCEERSQMAVTATNPEVAATASLVAS
jgi:methyl-accepting chemotaxis protein